MTLKQKIKRRRPGAHQRQKKKTNKWCSRYIRLRNARADGTVECVTCGSLWPVAKIQAGHFIGRGMGGSSGVYFDARNIHPQCVPCNGFKGGAPKEYEQFMQDTYGQGVIDELRVRHKINSYTLEQLVGLELYFKQETERLLDELGLKSWW